MTHPTPALSSARRARSPATARLLGAALAAASALVLATPAQADPGQRMHGGHGGHGGGHAAMHAMAGMPGLPGMGPMGAHPRMVERMLDTVNATPEQRSQIRSLLDAARGQAMAEREGGRILREQAASLFAQPTVDANAAEALRLQMIARADAASRRATQLMLEVSRVLTPEQRALMVQRLQERRERMAQRRAERAQQRGAMPGQAEPRF